MSLMDELIGTAMRVRACNELEKCDACAFSEQCRAKGNPMLAVPALMERAAARLQKYDAIGLTYESEIAALQEQLKELTGRDGVYGGDSR